MYILYTVYCILYIQYCIQYTIYNINILYILLYTAGFSTLGTLKYTPIK